MLYTRKSKLIALGVLFAVVVIYGWRQQWFGSGQMKGGAWDAVPENACMVIESAGWRSLDAGMKPLPYAPALREALLAPVISRIISECSLLAGDKAKMDRIPFLSSVHLAKVGELDILTIIENGDAARACKKGLKKMSAQGKATTYQYKRKQIYILPDSLGRKLTLTVVNDLVLASYTAFLVEDALAQLIVGSNLIADAHAMLMSKVKQDGPLKILFYYPNTPLWLGGFMSPDMVKQKEKWANFATASLFDISFKSNELLAQGATIGAEGQNLHAYSNLMGMPPVPAAARTVVPLYFNAAPSNRQERLLARWFSGKGWVVSQPSLITEKPQQVLWLESNDNDKKLDSLVSYMNIKLPKGASRVRMLKIPNSWQKRVLGKNYFKSDSLWLWVSDSGHVLLSDSDTRLLTWQWSEASGYLQSNPLQPNLVTFSLWYRNNISYSPSMNVKDEVGGDIYDPLRHGMESFTMSVKESDGIWPTTISIRMKPAEATFSLIPWWINETAAAIVRGPFTITSAEKVLTVAQDTLRNLYAWDADGHLLWKKTLDGLIAGDVFGIDYHGNGQLQVMLTTTKMVHCLNDKGNEVGGYPLKLAATAAVLSLSGRDDKAKYYITSTTGDVYGFDISGRPLQGLSPVKANALLLPAMQWEDGGPIAIATRDGQVKAWKQDSKPAWTVKLPAKLVGVPVIIPVDSVGNVWTGVLQDGSRVYIASDGTMKRSGASAPGTLQAGISGASFSWKYVKGNFSLYPFTGSDAIAVSLPGSPSAIWSVEIAGAYAGIFTDKGIFWISTDNGAIAAQTPAHENGKAGFFTLENRQPLSGVSVKADSNKVQMWLLGDTH